MIDNQHIGMNYVTPGISCLFQVKQIFSFSLI